MIIWHFTNTGFPELRLGWSITCSLIKRFHNCETLLISRYSSIQKLYRLSHSGRQQTYPVTVIKDTTTRKITIMRAPQRSDVQTTILNDKKNT